MPHKVVLSGTRAVKKHRCLLVRMQIAADGHDAALDVDHHLHHVAEGGLGQIPQVRDRDVVPSTISISWHGDQRIPKTFMTSSP